MELHGDHWARGARLDFAVNVVPGGPPPWLADAVREGLATIGDYPDEEAATLAVARRHGRAPEEVVLLNGGAQGFTLLAEALTPARPVVVHPSFMEPDDVLTVRGRAPRRVVLAPPYRLATATVPDDADLVVIGNPTNPTGVLHPQDAVTALTRPGRVMAIDEAFMDFVAGEAASLAGDPRPGLVVLRSLTKILAVPGLRVGYMLAEPQLAACLRGLRPAWSVNALALAALVAACERPEHLQSVAADVASARGMLAERLTELPGVYVHPGAANFLLVELPDGEAVRTALRTRFGIAVRPAGGFPGLGPDHVRIAVRGHPDDDELVDALRTVLVGSPAR